MRWSRWEAARPQMSTENRVKEVLPTASQDSSYFFLFAEAEFILVQFDDILDEDFLETLLPNVFSDSDSDYLVDSEGEEDESSVEAHTGSNKHLSDKEKIRIFNLHASGRSCRAIAKTVGRSRKAVGKVVENWTANQSLERLPGSGRPRKSSDRDDRLIIRLLEDNRTIAA
eukprot:gene25971-31363_t